MKVDFSSFRSGSTYPTLSISSDIRNDTFYSLTFYYCYTPKSYSLLCVHHSPVNSQDKLSLDVDSLNFFLS